MIKKVLEIISWNVNGLRSLLKTTYLDDLIENNNPDILCLSEVKINNLVQKDLDAKIHAKYPQYEYRYWNTGNIKHGYSGTAVFMKMKPINVMYGLNYDNKDIDNEGRVITIEMNKYYLINIYTPNSGEGLHRLEWRIHIWDTAFKMYINKLQKHKPVIICGDLNVAHNEIDLKNPKTNTKSAGFTKEERESFNLLLNKLNLIDVFRYLHPNKIEYTFWSYKRNSRANNTGWRIDYFLISENIKSKLEKCIILHNILGSDHAPILLSLK
jgi:exodeoxyribonuclease-3